MGLFGSDQIKLTLEKYAYVPGDVIRGNAALNLKKPVRARKLIVSFIGIRIERHRGTRVSGGPGYHHHHTSEKHRYVIYNFEIPLDGENTYFNEMYPFEIKIPQDILKSPQSQPEGKVGSFIRVLQDIAAANSRLEWHVEAKLDVPMNLDIRKKRKIVISQ